MKKFRIEIADLTQKELAKKIDCNSQFISNWERKLCLPPMKQVKFIKKHYKNFDTEKFIECASHDYQIKFRNKMKRALK